MKKVVGFVAIYVTLCLLSWLITCGFVKLITLCFGWPFRWAYATGVWLIFFLVNISLKKGKGDVDEGEDALDEFLRG